MLITNAFFFHIENSKKDKTKTIQAPALQVSDPQCCMKEEGEEGGEMLMEEIEEETCDNEDPVYATETSTTETETGANVKLTSKLVLYYKVFIH